MVSVNASFPGLLILSVWCQLLLLRTACISRLSRPYKCSVYSTCRGTANLFSHWRYASGASTNPDAHVFAYAAAQVKKAMEVTYRLKGENYVFWGGREGYQSTLNTNVRRELDNFAAFLKMAVEHKQVRRGGLGERRCGVV